MFYKKAALENKAKFTGKHLCQSLFFNKKRSATILKRAYFEEHLWTTDSVLKIQDWNSWEVIDMQIYILCFICSMQNLLLIFRFEYIFFVADYVAIISTGALNFKSLQRHVTYDHLILKKQFQRTLFRGLISPEEKLKED